MLLSGLKKHCLVAVMICLSWKCHRKAAQLQKIVKTENDLATENNKKNPVGHTCKKSLDLFYGDLGATRRILLYWFRLIQGKSLTDKIKDLTSFHWNSTKPWNLKLPLFTLRGLSEWRIWQRPPLSHRSKFKTKWNTREKKLNVWNI